MILNRAPVAHASKPGPSPQARRDYQQDARKRSRQLVSAPQVAVKRPFATPFSSGGNGYDFARDLSTVVFARRAGHADLYLLSQK
jgi:hypothetical protein